METLASASQPTVQQGTELDSGYELRIAPNKSWIRIDWRGIWEYRDLLFLLVRRDFVSKYKQTVLGPLWFIIQPLFTSLIFTVIFGQCGQAIDGWDAAAPVLPLRHAGMELLRKHFQPPPRSRW